MIFIIANTYYACLKYSNNYLKQGYPYKKYLHTRGFKKTGRGNNKRGKPSKYPRVP